MNHINYPHDGRWTHDGLLLPITPVDLISNDGVCSHCAQNRYAQPLSPTLLSHISRSFARPIRPIRILFISFDGTARTHRMHTQAQSFATPHCATAHKIDDDHTTLSASSALPSPPQLNRTTRQLTEHTHTHNAA